MKNPSLHLFLAIATLTTAACSKKSESPQPTTAPAAATPPAAAPSSIAEAAKTAVSETKAATQTATNDLKSAATNLQAQATAAAQSATAKTESTLSSLASNLTPANLTSWYEGVSKDSGALITSLGAKAAELGAQASPKFKSLYDQAVVQKKNFDSIYTQAKDGGIAKWAELYPKLQASWGDLSKTLTEAKALLN